MQDDGSSGELLGPCTENSHCNWIHGLRCIEGKCRCRKNYVWYNGRCVKYPDEGSAGVLQPCIANSDCKTIAGLKCRAGRCICKPRTYWNIYRCVPYEGEVHKNVTSLIYPRKGGEGDVLKPCQFNEQCNAIIGLICNHGICVCPDDKYWKQNKCLSLEGALEDGSFDQKCLKPEECNQVVGLTCIRGRCKCARHSKWNGFYCTIDGTILNCHWYN
ncbi:hypothetical protein ACOME3_007068 [Neoechinorhynchus agilis]